MGLSTFLMNVAPAAEVNHDVDFAQRVPTGIAQGLQHCVADIVAMGVVDFLGSVRCPSGAGSVGSYNVCTRRSYACPPDEITLVVKTGQDVGVRFRF